MALNQPGLSDIERHWFHPRKDTDQSAKWFRHVYIPQCTSSLLTSSGKVQRRTNYTSRKR